MEEEHEPGTTNVGMQTGTVSEPTADGTTDTAMQTGHTISSEDSGSDGEVQSSPEGFEIGRAHV